MSGILVVLIAMPMFSILAAAAPCAPITVFPSAKHGHPGSWMHEQSDEATVIQAARRITDPAFIRTGQGTDGDSKWEEKQGKWK